MNSSEFLNIYHYNPLVVKLFNLAVLGYFLGLGFMAVVIKGALRNYKLIWLSMLFLVLILFAGLRLFFDGTGPLASILGTEIRPFYLCVLAPLAAFCSYTRISGLVPFYAAFLIGLVLKSFYLVAIYVKGGGVVFMANVRSVTADGGYLTNLVIGIMICGALGLYFSRPGKWRYAVVFGSIALFLLVPAVGSFRRSTMLYSIMVFLIGVGLYYYLQGRLLQKIPAAMAILLCFVALGASSYIAFFGLEDSIERARSLTFKSEGSGYAGSNDYYLDDWYAWSAVLKKQALLGVGFKNQYGVATRMEMELAEASSEIPLHVGMFELWARLGVVGAFVHLVAFVLLPLKLLFFNRIQPVIEYHLMAAFSIALLVFIGLFPFSPPQYLNLNFLIPCSLGWGLLAAAYYPEPLFFAKREGPARRAKQPR